MMVNIIQDFNRLSNLPVLLEEVSSYPSRTEDYGIPATIYWHEGMTQEVQAEWDTGVFRIAMGLPYVLGVQMVHIVPDNPPEWGPRLYGGTLVGTDFLTQDNKQKQVYYAMKDLFDSWTASENAVTDSNGNLTIRGYSGDYDLKITTKNGDILQTKTHVSEQQNNNINLTVAGGSISGYVVESDGKTPITKALVTVFGYDTDQFFNEVSTGNDGGYTISGLARGKYKVSAWLPGYIRGYWESVLFSDKATAVHVSASKKTRNINFNLEISSSQSITPIVATASLPDGEVNINYSQTMAVTGGFPPYSWSIAKGSSLPKGLTLKKSTGVISGKPFKAGTFNFTLQLMDKYNNMSTGSLSINIMPTISKLSLRLSPVLR